MGAHLFIDTSLWEKKKHAEHYYTGCSVVPVFAVGVLVGNPVTVDKVAWEQGAKYDEGAEWGQGR